MKKTLLAVTLAALTSGAATTALAADPKAPAPDFEISGNFALVSDYRFRGISQSNLKPAVQGGIDLTHKSGFYVGNWNSSVSEWTAPNGGGLEMDFYGGYTTEIVGVGIDVGAVYYYYPGAKNSAADSKNYWNTSEAYLGLSYGPISLKTSYTLSDRYFSLGKEASGNLSGLSSTEDVKGTLYYSLSLEHALTETVTLTASAGYLDLKNATGYSIKDYSIGAGYALPNDWSVSLTMVKASLEDRAKTEAFFEDVALKKLYKSGAVISLSKSF